MALFTLSDPHLSLSVDKPMDVFGGAWNHYTEKLKEYWEYMVNPDDTVVLPGDISWGMNLEEAEADFRFLHSLPGQKYLLKGNHDYWWNSLKKMNEFLEEKGFSSLHFLQNNAVFAEGKILCGSRGWMCEDKMTEQDEKILAREAIRFEIGLKCADELRKKCTAEGKEEPEIICFSHYPVVTETVRENPILDLLKEYGVRRCYYGHLHNRGNKPVRDECGGISFFLVSADACAFTPVRIE